MGPFCEMYETELLGRKQQNAMEVCELVDVDQNSLETDISRLVNDGMISCKIDRLGGLVDFRKKTTPHEQLNEWGNGLESLMGLVNQTAHLISKEYILANAKIGAK